MKDYPINRVRDWFKGAVKSLTIWFNSSAALLIVALPDIQNTLPQLAKYLGADVYKYLALIVVFSNIGLRAKTNKALADK
jgi:hypothetical protein